jgi:polyvinyl alcohol dehydrogenase (cytochrome)
MSGTVTARRSGHRVWFTLTAAVVVALGTVAFAIGRSGGDAGRSTAAAATAAPTAAITPGQWDWPTYGHDAQHSFDGQTTLTKATVPTLRQAWSFPTGDAVTATPTVVGGTVYVGSWDGFFYAIDLSTGKLRWKFQLKPQPAVSPQPGVQPRDSSSDGGLVTSSAWFQKGHGNRPPLVIFGGGYTLYALNAVDGTLVWEHDYTGRPDLPPSPAADGTRIFSSPVVVDGKVIVGIDPNGQGYGGYVVAASLATGDPVWQFQTDVDQTGNILNDGCGGVWSSGTLLPRTGLVLFDTADCHFSNPPPFNETVIALRVRDGTLAWVFRPARPDVNCDTDFGATVNAGLDRNGKAVFTGVGSKDGTYYSLDPKTGALRWSTNVVFGGFSGGFIGTAAYDGQQVIGSTALGDFGRFERSGNVLCDPTNPRDLPIQEPSVHALDASTGKVLWEVEKAQSFGPTTFAGGMTFNGVALSNVIQVRSAETGGLLVSLPLGPAPCWSGIATVGDAIVFGTGASHIGAPDGVVVYTPGGQAPSVPVG